MSGQTIKLDLNSDLKEGALGILWDRKTDKSTFKHITKSNSKTKSCILSLIVSISDHNSPWSV